jgi:hypothetical protein
VNIYRIYWADCGDLEDAEFTREVGLVLAESLDECKQLYPMPKGATEDEAFDGVYHYQELVDPSEVRDMMTNVVWEIDFITDDRIREAMVKGITNAISEMVL